MSRERESDIFFPLMNNNVHKERKRNVYAVSDEVDYLSNDVD